MRLKEDNSSWQARGIIRRDFRHDYGTPEVPKGHPKRKRAKAKAPKHKHVWAKDTHHGDYWRSLGIPEPPCRSEVYTCSVPGCEKRKYVTNQRFGYEYYKWARDNEHRYHAFKRAYKALLF